MTGSSKFPTAAVWIALAATGSAQDQWQSLGPSPIAQSFYTGRVAAVVCSSRDSGRYYVGGADGGVWRTDDGGSTWRSLGDTLPTTAIGALALDPNDDRIVFAGTGEANFANHSRYGLGLARSRDGGHTWEVLAESTFAGRCCSRIRVDPIDTRRLWASITHAGGFPARAAAREHPLKDGPLGLFRSDDQGDTWRQVAGGSTGLPDLSATDVALDPRDPGTVYVAIGDIFGDSRNGIYKSADGGATFRKLGGGLPATDVGRITIAISPSNGDRIYAQVVQQSSASGGSAAMRGVYRSDDAGGTWRDVSPTNYQASYGWYLCTSAVHPTNPNIVFVGGLSCRRSTDGGSSWRTVTPPHVDLHALEFDAAGRLVCGDDGGVHRTADLGGRWDSLNDGLGLIQFYAGISVHPNDPDVVYGGLQDNGSVQRTSAGWFSVLGGDGGYTGVDPTGTRVFVEYQGTGNLFRSVGGGSLRRSSTGISGRNCFLPPYEIHPGNPLHMIYGTERVFRSTDGGTSWSPISADLTGGSGAIRGLAWAPSDDRYIYVGTNDGRVQATENRGQSWRLCLTGVPGWPRTMRQLAVHPTRPRHGYLAVAAFGVDQIRFTDDAGRTWRSLDGDLPDLPANTVAVEHVVGEPPILYLGTDQGVWRSVDHGVHWFPYAVGIPNSPVIDLRVDSQNGRLLAATQGRGLWNVRLVRREDGLPFLRRR